MCASCGCGEPDEPHGNQNNILLSDIRNAAVAANTTPDKVVANIQKTVEENPA